MGLFLVVLLYLAVVILTVAGAWKVFVKAGEPGWAVLIPLYNTYILLKIAGKPWWWLLLMLVPCVGVVVAVMAVVALAKTFGKGVGFAIGLILVPFICYPMLGFGSAQYTPPPPAA